ncbi:microcephalin [Protopterus annectens]|uniref:microcephalin n=1 Tax=Protopterus annectens TaxID=7888 RepID=UPI001CF9A3B8|nr:microcephalin [Protopterus annectens]
MKKCVFNMAIDSDSSRGNPCEVLKDVVAFVEVWSSSRTENYSKTFAQQLLDMGATVSFYCFKCCREAEAHVDELLYPAVNENEGLPDKIVKHRCMQPKDFIEKTPESNRRLRRRLDKLFENLKMQKAGAGSELPALSFSEDGLVQYSPSAITGRCSAMEKRIREMKDKRENLSPTASQMYNSNSQTVSLQPIDSSSAIPLSTEVLPEDKLCTSFTELWERPEGLEVSVDQWQKAAALSSTSYKASEKLPALNNYGLKNETPQTFNKLLGKKKFDFFDSNDFVSKSAGKRIVKRKSFSKSSLENVGTDSATNFSCTTLGGPSSPHSKVSEDKTTHLFHKQSSVENEDPKPSNKIHTTMKNTVQLDSPITKGNVFSLSCPLLEPMENSKKQKCRKGRKSLTPMVKLTVEDLTHTVAEGDSPLHIMRTPGLSLDWSPSTEEVGSAYEDFFSPVNLRENKLRLPSLGALVLKSASPSNAFGVKSPAGNKRLKLMHGFDKMKSKQKKKCVSTSISNASVDCGTNPSIANKLPETNCISGDGNKSLNITVDLRKDLRIACTDKNQKRCRKSVGRAGSAKSPVCIEDNIFSLPLQVNEPCISSPERSVIPDSHSGDHEHIKAPSIISKMADVKTECSVFSECSNKQVELDVLGKKEHEKSSNVLLKHKGMQECHHLTMETTEETFPCSTGKPVSSPQKTSGLHEPSTCDVQNNTAHEKVELCYQKSGSSKAKQMPKRTLVMTSMASEMQQTAIQVVNKLGGFAFSDSVCETTTHVVTGSPRRTLNVLFGIARGCWILSFDWVLWSLEHGYWIPEEPYEASNHFPAASICRLQQYLSKGKYQQDLFVNQPLMYVSSSTQPPFKKLTELIQLCGGKVCKSLRPARICIGDYCGKKLPEIKYLSEQWILDSITQYSVCPFENYILNSCVA